MIIRILLVGSLVGAATVVSAREFEVSPAIPARTRPADASPGAPDSDCTKRDPPERRQDRDCLKLLNQTGWTYDAGDLARDVHAIERKASDDPDKRSATFRQAPPADALGADIAKAARPDCRTAYQGMLLLAIPFLIKDTITGTGCRW